MPLILGANSVSGGYNVANSLRFEPSSSDYFNRTSGTSTDNKKLTFSFWVKRGNSAREQFFVNSSGSACQTYFASDDKIYFTDGTASGQYKTTQVFRDFSAWYHFVFAEDTTQATASDRIKIYVNGTQITVFDITTPPTLNANSGWNANSTATYIGRYNPSPAGYYYSGYMSEFNFIDGQQLTPSSFGETDFDSGIWKPKAYTGSFGTNGFYLQFKNSGSLGLDSSGNANNFTVNNLTSVDQSTDTCTNNFCTLNPLDTQVGTTVAFAEGNLQITPSASATCPTRSTIAVDKGKWYWEVKVVSSTSQQAMIGIADVTSSAVNSGSIIGGDAKSYGYYAGTGEKYNNNSGAAYGATYTNGDIIGVALNMDSGTIVFYKNGTTQGTAFSSLSGFFSPAFSDGGGGSAPEVILQTNFGSPSYAANSYADAEGFGNFSYAVPAGYFALCSKNLAKYA